MIISHATVTTFACFVLISLGSPDNILYTAQSEHGIQAYQPPQGHRWHCFNSMALNNTIDCCFHKVKCLKSGPALPYGYCATYSEDNNTQSLSVAKCSDFLSSSPRFNQTYQEGNKFVQLPISLSELNDYMCGPMNRKGRACSQCADGYGPSVLSNDYECAKCTNSWSGILKYISVRFVPVTIFYFITLIFRISVTTPPMPCFIMYAQIVFIFIRANFLWLMSSKVYGLLESEEDTIRLDLKIVDTFYGLFSMQSVFRYILHPLCVSSKMEFIHIVFLNYAVSFYPIFLICVTLFFIKLHNNNFRPIVMVWRPFHKCFTRLHRGWDTKRDLVDVFTAFFFLSSSNFLNLAYKLCNRSGVITFKSSGEEVQDYVLSLDMKIAYFSHIHIILFTISLVAMLIYYVLPSLLLTLYPFKCFNRILSKCHLDLISMKIFVDKIQSHYRNGLDGGKDMRSFSSLYLFLRLSVFAISHGIVVTHLIHHMWYAVGFVMMCTALTVAIGRPYKKDSMNNIDTLLLFDLAMFCFAMSSGLLMFARVLLFIPMVVFLLTLTFQIIQRLFKLCSVNVVNNLCGKCNNCRRFQFPSGTGRDISAEISVAPSATQPLIQPTSTEVSYDTCIGKGHVHH